MEIIQQLLHGPLAPWTETFKSRNALYKILRTLPYPDNDGGKYFLRDLPKYFRKTNARADTALIQSCNTLSQIPPGNLLSGMLCNLIYLCAPKTPYFRFYYYLIGYSTERLLANLEAMSKNDNDQDDWQEYAMKMFDRLKTYHQATATAVQEHPRHLTFLTYLDMFITFTMELIALHLKRTSIDFRAPKSDQVLFSQLYGLAALPTLIGDTRRILAEILFIIGYLLRNQSYISGFGLYSDDLVTASVVDNFRKTIIEVSQRDLDSYISDVYLTRREIAIRYDIPAATIRNWMKNLTLVDYMKKGGKYYFHEDEIIRVMFDHYSYRYGRRAKGKR